MFQTTQPTPAVIDKIRMVNYDFRVKSDHRLTTMYGKYPGDDSLHQRKRFYNSELGVIELHKDIRNNDVCVLTYNPNKVGIEACVQLCRDAGILMNVDDSRPIRLDIARDSVLSMNTTAYHPVFQYAMSGRVRWNVAHNTTCRIGNELSEIGFYDKSKESKLDTPGIHRLELRLRKSTYIKKAGILNFTDLKQHDTDMLLEIYRQNGMRILPNLIIKNEQVEQIGNMVMMLERCYTDFKRPLTTFFSIYGVMSFSSETIYTAIQTANLTKQQKYAARKQLNEYMSLIKLNSPASFVQQEIINYFAA